MVAAGARIQAAEEGAARFPGEGGEEEVRGPEATALTAAAAVAAAAGGPLHLNVAGVVAAAAAAVAEAAEVTGHVFC